MEKEIQEKVKELQVFEQNLQNLLMQKQAFQLELNETNSALEELEGSKDEVYKIVGNVMIKSKKEILVKELKERLGILDLRVRNIEKQEQLIRKKAESIRESVMKKMR